MRKHRARSGLPIVFLGPSLPRQAAAKILQADFRPPIRRGDLADVGDGQVVGIIDGQFDQSLSVSPREVLLAVKRGVLLFGSSSMGALRAAEVPGMAGIGHIYQLFRDERIVDDDEVAL